MGNTMGRRYSGLIDTSLKLGVGRGKVIKVAFSFFKMI